MRGRPTKEFACYKGDEKEDIEEYLDEGEKR